MASDEGPRMNKLLLYGAGAATMAGVLMGAALKVSVEPGSQYGQQLLISQPRAHNPSAVDLWTPAEGAPPYFSEASWQPPRSEIDKALTRLMSFGDQPPPPRPQVYARAEPALADPEPDASERDAFEPDGPDTYRIAAGPAPAPEPIGWGWRSQSSDPPPELDDDRPRDDAPYDRDDGPGEDAYLAQAPTAPYDGYR